MLIDLTITEQINECRNMSIFPIEEYAENEEGKSELVGINYGCIVSHPLTYKDYVKKYEAFNDYINNHSEKTDQFYKFKLLQFNASLNSTCKYRGWNLREVEE